MDWLRSEALKEEKNATNPIAITPVEELTSLCRCRGAQGLSLDMHRTNPELLDPDTSDRSATADVLLRQDPEEGGDEEEDEGDDKEEDDEESDGGYSE